jgi:hypothetical protein
MRLIQFVSANGERHVGLVEDGDTAHVLPPPVCTVYELALRADAEQVSLEALVARLMTSSVELADYRAILAEQRILPPLDHPDPAHCLVTGTGLTHLGSAKARDGMHAKPSAQTDQPLTDSMRMFQWGMAGGKPPLGQISTQPEWFYKGNGHGVVPPEQPLERPTFAEDGGEEAELVGLYVVGAAGTVWRVGTALGNEFSDHVMEKRNYLWLAHSKLRSCSFGPELLIGEPPKDVRGRVRVVRNGAVVWEEAFWTGEANMTYRLDGLEHHHFKYAQFRQPGDVHCHFFGTGTLSFAAGVQPRHGDLFEIEAPPYGRPLRNPLQVSDADDPLVAVHPL